MAGHDRGPAGTTPERGHGSARGTPRIGDVAREARVSSATVSRVLNGTSRVSPELRERVLAAVHDLGYVPHGPARALAMRRSHTIGAIIPTVDNAIFATCVQALQDRLFQHGYALVLASSDYSFERERRAAGALLSHGIDALMLVGSDHDPQVYAQLARKRIPYLNVWIHHAHSEHPCLGFDNAAAAAALTRYLLELGHREVAMIAGITAGNDRARERVQGVRGALAARGLGFGPGRFCEAPYDIEAARQATARLLDAASPPTAIVCGNDVQAMGALFECQARGVDVPAEMSVTGYDGLDLAGHVQPPITTVEIPSAEMGRRAADDLMARVEQREAPLRVELGTRLLVRGTTGPPRRGALAPA